MRRDICPLSPHRLGWVLVMALFGVGGPQHVIFQLDRRGGDVCPLLSFLSLSLSDPLALAVRRRRSTPIFHLGGTAYPVDRRSSFIGSPETCKCKAS